MTHPTYFRALIGLRTQTPLHAGVMGGTHILDRPIHREVHTNWPKLSSNALKGALRETCTAAQKRDVLFGKENHLLSSGEDGKSERHIGKAGLLSFTDARLLLFPVRSARGTWAWTTCPGALRRLREEVILAGLGAEEAVSQDFFNALEFAISDQAVYAGRLLRIDHDYLQLYQHTLRIDNRLTTDHIYNWQAGLPLLAGLTDLADRVVILSDDNFGMMTRLYTEITTRNKINDDTFTTGGGTLFTEEHLPANALLYALAFSMPDTTHEHLASQLDMSPRQIQIGGNATLGRGLCNLTWHTPTLESIPA